MSSYLCADTEPQQINKKIIKKLIDEIRVDILWSSTAMRYRTLTILYLIILKNHTAFRYQFQNKFSMMITRLIQKPLARSWEKVRMDSGFKIREFAEIIGVTEDTVINWELRGMKPLRNKVKKSINGFMEDNCY